MDRSNRFALLAMFCAIMALEGVMETALADITVDGNLLDWGVTPFSDWTPDLAPGADYVVGNWHNQSFPNGGETFDLEALFVAADENYLYIAIVGSMPETGAQDPYGRNVTYTPGDICLNLDVANEPGTVTGEYGYEYGVRTTGDPAQSDPDGANPGDRKGAVYYLPDWSLPHGQYGFPANGPSTMTAGTYVGAGDLVYVDGDEAYYGAGGGLLEGSSATYIIETALPWGIFDDLMATDHKLFYYTMSCGNDTLKLCSELIPPKQVVPEPATVVFLGTVSALGMVARRRRTRSQAR